MAFTAPLFIPLSKGLDLSKEAALGGGELHLAENVDFDVEGQVKGRPARSAALLFAPVDPAVAYGYQADMAFTATGYQPAGLVRLRDVNGERPALACEGRLFTQDGTRWVDRGPFACARVDQIATFRQHLSGTERGAVAPDFGLMSSGNSGGTDYAVFNLLTPEGEFDRTVRITLSAPMVFKAANAARCGTTTAMVFVTTDNALNLVYRVNGASTLGSNGLAINALATITDVGDAPSISASYDSAHFFIAYKSTAANVVKILKTTTTGTVVATYTSGAIAGLMGVWVDNSSIAKDKVVLGVTTSTGMTIRILSHALVDLGFDSTVANGAAGLDCVVGMDDDVTALRAPRVWWAYRSADAVGDGNIAIGWASTTAAASATQTAYYYGGGLYQEAAVRWGIAHQPIRVNGRMYFTLTAAANRNKTGTWMTLDLTDNYWTWNAVTTPVATGPVETTIPFLAPSSAVRLTDDSGYTFQTLDWAQFQVDQASVTTGYEAAVRLVKLTRSKPQAAQFQDLTVFSGSIPYMVAGGQAYELGFPFCGGIPGISASIVPGGAITLGNTYSACAVWRWVDEAGTVHRSAPSVVKSGLTTTAGNLTIRCVVTNPVLTAKNYSDLRIEVYTTGYSGATPTTELKLQTTVALSLSDAYTIVDINTDPVTNTDTLYTEGNVFENFHVPGDGGVAAVGRRLWLAGARSVYASKLSMPGEGPGFSDVGNPPPLALPLPAGAGRVVALETLDDKLVIFCTRGVYVVADGGPDNTGDGSDFGNPFRLSQLSIAGPRSAVSTDLGVLFCTAPDSVDAARGGVWLLDRQLTITERQYAGRGAQDYFLGNGSWVPEVAYAPERQQAYVSVPNATATQSGVVVFDQRNGKIATWGHPGSDLRSIACANGVLWTLGDEPQAYDLAPGTDITEGDVTMQLYTSHLAANGQSALGWSRVRSITPLCSPSSGAHTMVIGAVQDTTRASTSGAIAVAAGGLDSTWPGSWQAPEWRLPTQKCSTIQVVLQATPATAKWAAIRLEVAPLATNAPAKSRS